LGRSATQIIINNLYYIISCALDGNKNTTIFISCTRYRVFRMLGIPVPCQARDNIIYHVRERFAVYCAHNLQSTVLTICSLPCSQFAVYCAHNLQSTVLTICSLPCSQFAVYCAQNLQSTVLTICSLLCSQFAVYCAHNLQSTVLKISTYLLDATISIPPSSQFFSFYIFVIPSYNIFPSGKYYWGASCYSCFSTQINLISPAGTIQI
jgi:hypothetical protein